MSGAGSGNARAGGSGTVQMKPVSADINVQTLSRDCRVTSDKHSATHCESRSFGSHWVA